MEKFNTSTAEKFRKGLYEKKILFDNFQLRFCTLSFASEEEFLATANDSELLRKAVSSKLNELASPETPANNIEAAQRELGMAYVDRYQIANIASYSFALWFYTFDQDNWFGYETIRTEIEPFLEEAYNRKNKTVFALLKGVDNKNINNDRINKTKESSTKRFDGSN